MGERIMSMYVFRDKERKRKLYAKQAIKENRDTRFFCPNIKCNAHMYICGLDGITAAYFSANRNGHSHVKGCPFGANNSFNPDDFDESAFDFDNAMDELATPSKQVKKKTEPGEHGTGESLPRPPRTIRQIYDMCKSYDVIDTYGNKKIGQMILDDRSLYMYPKGVFGKKIIECKASQYFYNSEKLEIKLIAPIAAGKYTFQVKIPDKDLFKHIKDTIYNNRNKIILISGDWGAGSTFNCFTTSLASKKQIAVIN